MMPLIIGSILVLFLIYLSLQKIFPAHSLEKVKRYITEENYYYAKELLLKIVKRKSVNILALWYLSQCYEALGEDKKAWQHLREIGKNPSELKKIKEADYHFLLGKVLAKLDKKEEALNEYLLVTQYAPTMAEAYFHVGKLFFEKRDNENAIKFLFKAVNIKKNDEQSHLLIGRIFYYIGLFDKAHEHLSLCLKFKEHFHLAHYYLANVEYKQQNYEKAIEQALLALQDQTSEKQIKLFYLLANCYEELRQHDKAIRYYEIASEKLPTEHPLKKDIYYHLALNYETINQITNAIMIWKRLYYIVPTYKDVQERYLKYSSIEHEETIKKMIEAPQEKLLKIMEKVLQKLSLEKIQHQFITSQILEIKAIERTENFAITILIHLNRNLEIIDSGSLENFYENMKYMNCEKGIYFCITEFTSRAISFSSQYAIDLIPRKQFLKLLV